MTDTAAPAAPAPETPTTPPAGTPAPEVKAAPAAPAPEAKAGEAPAAKPSLASEIPTPQPVSIDDARKYLVEKGSKAEDLAALDETALRAKYDEAKAAEAKPGEKAEIQIKAPEGLTLDEKVAGEFKTLLTDEKLSGQERADKLIEMHANEIKKALEGSHDLWRKTQETWRTTVAADPELGGANYDAMRSTLAKALDEIGGNEAAKMREALDYTGAGNNPEIIRLFYRMAKAVTEGGPVLGGSPAAAAKEQNVAKVLYPDAA